MNVILASVGRRAHMVKFFKEAIGNGGRVHAGNFEIERSPFTMPTKL